MSADVLEEIRDNRTFATTEWDAIREDARKDRLCVAGKPWQALDPDAVKERDQTKRPYLSSDELSQYINQTVNDVRANPRGIKFAPTGNGANDKGAEFYQNHTREIEYRSHARVGYSTAFDNAVTASYGWIRIRTKRQHVRTFNQDIWIDPIVNPDQVLPDPNAVWPDSRDMKFLFYLEPWTRTEFKRRWPNAKAASFSLDTSKIAPGWLSQKQIDVAEYWRLETFERTLVAYQMPGSDDLQTALIDELPDGKLPEGVKNLREEKVDDTRVQCFITNGLEVLDEPKWSGKYLPWVSCFGKILYVQEGGGTRRHLVSMTRLARDPYMAYCYMITCEAEAVGGIPRGQWVGYEGQFAKPERWAKASRQPVAFLEAKVSVPGNPTQSPLPLPQKQSWDPPLQNLEIAIESRRRAIQAAMGITPLPTPVQRDNQKSGKALQQIESSGQRGSFHFVDHYDLMIERAGVIIEDLMDKVIDTARDVPIRKPNDDAGIVRVNDPTQPDSISTKGDYRVTVSTGPASESQRQDAADFVDTLVGNLGEIAQMAGPHVALKVLAQSIKLKQLGPIGDAIIELLDPPQMGQDGKPLPPEVATLLGQNKQLQQLLQQAQQAQQAKVAEQQGKFQIVKYQTDAKSQDAAADREVKLAVAELSAKVDRLALFLEESHIVGERAHASRESAHQRVHETIESAKDRAHERFQSAADHAEALDAQDQAGQIAATAQAADHAAQPAASE